MIVDFYIYFYEINGIRLYVIKEIDEIDFSYRWRKTKTLNILYVFAYYVYPMNSYIFQSS